MNNKKLTSEKNNKINSNELKYFEDMDLDSTINDLDKFNLTSDELKVLTANFSEENLTQKRNSFFNSIELLLNDFIKHKDILEALNKNNKITNIIVLQAIYLFSCLYAILKKKHSFKLPNINSHNSTNSFNDDEKLVIGIVGCGDIGINLLKKLIIIKSGFPMKIKVSTRRPDLLSSLLTDLDNDVEIFLDNDKIFLESDIIFLAVQLQQLDIVCKEVINSFKQRMALLNNTLNVNQQSTLNLNQINTKSYPIFISFVLGISEDKLRSLLDCKVSFIFKTKFEGELFTNENWEEEAFDNLFKHLNELHLQGDGKSDLSNEAIYHLFSEFKRLVEEITKLSMLKKKKKNKEDKISNKGSIVDDSNQLEHDKSVLEALGVKELNFNSLKVKFMEIAKLIN